MQVPEHENAACAASHLTGSHLQSPRIAPICGFQPLLFRLMNRRLFFLLIAALMSRPLFGADVDGQTRAFLQQHCFDCHTGEEPEAGLNLEALTADLGDRSTFQKWVQVFDRVESGEMPPPDSADLEPSVRKQFLSRASDRLLKHQRSEYAALGRVRARRLTNRQLERTLHDLLGIDIPLARELPDEPRTAGFTTVANGQPMSHFQLERHLGLIDIALDEAFRRAASPNDAESRELNARRLSRRNARRRTREPELIKDRAVTWSSTLVFYGRLPSTTAREAGWYRFRVRASALKAPPGRGVWCSVRSGMCVSSAPLLEWVHAFEATAEPQEWTFEAWLPRGHMLEIRPGDATLKKARFRGGQVGTGEGGPQNVPGLALHSLTMKRIHRGPDHATVREILFGDLPVEAQWDRSSRETRLVVTAGQPKADLTRLVRRFAHRAFRRPTDASDVQPFVQLAISALENGEPFAEALRGAYRALLCSPRFVYLHESPGRLDDYSLASRLSYFLWGSMPDAKLLSLAESGELAKPSVLRGQIERLLNHPRGRDFVRDFAHEWLELSEIDFTQPDRRLYPEFDLVVQQSMLAETHAFLQEMLDQNLSVTNLIDADFTYLNSRLADYYGIEGVRGDRLTKTKLPASSRRGGVLTQGSVLKVTANGTNTSPVIRGVWVAERLLGEPIPPPPENIPAIEPDIRGAKSIRDMLAKHRSEASCASCHVKIDPPGFALENFDPAGQWRDRYGRRGRGAKIDPSYQFADGTPFAGINQFRKRIVSRPESLARNVVEKMLTYGTGGEIQFADRGEVQRLVSRSADGNFGFRDILAAVVTSETFLSK